MDATPEMSKEAEAQDVQTNGSEKEQLYTEIIYKEARSLLAKYLPEALPQEPTEILEGLTPFYMGKFKGKHYIQKERPFLSHAQVTRQIEEMKRVQESIQQHHEEEMAWIRLMAERLESGEWTTDTNFDELEKEFFKPKELEPLPKLPPEDWEKPERLLKGYDQYSLDTWGGYTV